MIIYITMMKIGGVIGPVVVTIINTMQIGIEGINMIGKITGGIIQIRYIIDLEERPLTPVHLETHMVIHPLTSRCTIQSLAPMR